MKPKATHCLPAALCSIALLCAHTPALALSDAEYKALKQSSESFSAAEQKLSAIWDKTRGELAQAELKALLADQKDWLQKRRDDQARQQIEALGLDKGEAYAAVTRERAARIETFRQQVELNSRTAYTGMATRCRAADTAKGLCLIPDNEIADVRIAAETEYTLDPKFFSTLEQLAEKGTRIRVTGKLVTPDNFDPRAKFKVSVIKPETASIPGSTPVTPQPDSSQQQPPPTQLNIPSVESATAGVEAPSTTDATTAAATQPAPNKPAPPPPPSRPMFNPEQILPNQDKY